MQQNQGYGQPVQQSQQQGKPQEDMFAGAFQARVTRRAHKYFPGASSGC
jgi:hypothetical protein